MRQNLRMTVSTPVTGVIMVLELFPICLLLIPVYCEDMTNNVSLLQYYYKTTIHADIWVCMIISVGTSARKILQKIYNDETIIYGRLRSILLRYKVITVIHLYIISFNLITGVFLKLNCEI